MIKIVSEELRPDALVLYNKEIISRKLSRIKEETAYETKSEETPVSFFSFVLIMVIIILGLFFLLYIITLIPPPQF